MLESYLRYRLSTIFIDAITLANVEAFAYLLSGLLYMKYGAKRMVGICYLIAAICSAVLIGVNDLTIPFAIMVLGVKIGISMAFNGTLLMSFDAYPISYIASIFGILQFISKAIGILGPFSGQLSFWLTMIIETAFCLLTALITFFFYAEGRI
jgi:hypothetical protein